MATKIFLKSPLSSLLSGYSYSNITQSVLALAASVTNTTASGTKIQATATGGGTALKWISPPIAADVTISGTVTFNLWAKEAATGNNAGIRMELVKYSGGAEGSVFAAASFGSPTELTTTMAVKNWTVAPTSTPFSRGDRIVAYVYIINVGTMGAGTPGVTMDYAGPTGAADGDSWFQTTENLTFIREPEFIQFAAGTGTTRSFPGVSASGNTIVGSVTWDDQTHTLTSVTDSKGNSYTVVESGTNWNGATNRFAKFYAQNITGGGAAITVTPNFNVAPTTVNIRIMEYGQVAAASVDQTTANATGTSTSPASANATPTSAYEMIVGLGEFVSGTFTAGSGFINRNTGTNGSIEDKGVSVLGSYNSSGTTSNVAWAQGTITLIGADQPLLDEDYWIPPTLAPPDNPVCIW